MSSAKTKAQEIIDAYPVAVFSKSFCPFCDATKSLLRQKGVSLEKESTKAKVLELDNMGGEGAAIQAALAEITGQSSVPNIFIAKKHIGGNSNIQDLNKHKQLDELLEEANAI